MSKYFALFIYFPFSILHFALFSSCCDCDEKPLAEEHFREAKWGMSRAEVKRLEPGEPVLERPDILQYRKFIEIPRRLFEDSLEADIYYIFTEDDKFFAGQYTFQLYWEDDIRSINQVITFKYGTPDDTLVIDEHEKGIIWRKWSDKEVVLGTTKFEHVSDTTRVTLVYRQPDIIRKRISPDL
jgi:hypothetical protein